MIFDLSVSGYGRFSIRNSKDSPVQEKKVEVPKELSPKKESKTKSEEKPEKEIKKEPKVKRAQEQSTRIETKEKYQQIENCKVVLSATECAKSF